MTMIMLQYLYDSMSYDHNISAPFRAPYGSSHIEGAGLMYLHNDRDGWRLCVILDIDDGT
jgi:hypothetical protein